MIFMNVSSFRLFALEKNRNAFECENHSRVPRQLAAYFLSAETTIGPHHTTSSNNSETGFEEVVAFYSKISKLCYRPSQDT